MIVHIQILPCRRLWGGPLHAGKTTAQAATVAPHKMMAVPAANLATMTTGRTIEERGILGSGRGIMVGSLGGNPPRRTVGGMSLRGGSRLTTVSPPIWRIVLGNRLRRGSPIAVRAVLALLPTRGARMRENRSQKIRTTRRGPITPSSNNTNSTKNAVGVTMTTN